jgi:hypothetical protein
MIPIRRPPPASHAIGNAKTEVKTAFSIVADFLQDPAAAWEKHTGGRDDAAIVTTGDEPPEPAACGVCAGFLYLARADGTRTPCPVCTQPPPRRGAP